MKYFNELINGHKYMAYALILLALVTLLAWGTLKIFNKYSNCEISQPKSKIDIVDYVKINDTTYAITIKYHNDSVFQGVLTTKSNINQFVNSFK